MYALVDEEGERAQDACCTVTSSENATPWDGHEASVTEQTPRPAPPIDEISRAFWTAGRAGQLLITRCLACGRRFHPPGPICPYCSGRAIEAVPTEGRGRVDSFTVVRRPWIPGYDTPYVVARVRLLEDPDVMLVANIVDCLPSEVRIGMDVDVLFEQRHDAFVPMFRPWP